ncbi:hypothetical protein CFAM422_012968 [Trichoderma lentiforme]|uniref:Uncharacterized protein n=1 Tax=Trichoderma lentiforme TaxID=1567552 RepID=A0A9P4X301_9HYPO|nr:hypothetical protein CFAM422_012968 [Trichoderma lentiforme]
MSDTNGPGPGSGHRRSSITQAALSNLFQRGPSNGSSGPPFPSNGNADSQRRRLSITTIGLSGTSPSNNSSFMRRGSMSTNSNNSDSIDENVIEDEDAFNGPRTAPTTPFVRHMSFGGNNAMRNLRTGGSPGNGKSPKSPPPSSLGRNQGGHGDQWTPLMSQSYPHQRQVSISGAWPAVGVGRRSSLHGPPSSHPQASNVQHPRVSSDIPPSRTDQFGFNWSEQLRSRAESSVTGARPSFSFQGTGSHSPPRAMPNHDRSKSISDMPQPPAQAASVKPKQPERPKPDAFQERILKGDFYMD